MHVRMFAKRIEVWIPDGINEIRIKRLWLGETVPEVLTWRVLHESSEWNSNHSEETITVKPGQIIEVASDLVSSPVIDYVRGRTMCLWPMGRRQLTEARDRLGPILKQVSARLTGAKR